MFFVSPPTPANPKTRTDVEQTMRGPWAAALGEEVADRCGHAGDRERSLVERAKVGSQKGQGVVTEN